jgi:FHA domain-containing protein
MSDFLGKMRDWLKPWMKGTSPLEIRRAILDDVESRVIAVGGGKRLFPFNRLRVHLLAPELQVRTELEAVVREGWNLKDEVMARLRERECSVPPGLEVDVAFEEAASPNFTERRFWVEYARAEAVPIPEVTAVARPTLEVTVLKGTATQHVYELDGERIYLGRLDEVVDSDGRVRRRNDVAFREEGEINHTVSREHARIAWDGGGYWLRTEQNASGTRIYRSGKTIDVSAHDRRGVRVQSGDEVHLGRAVVKVTFKS